MLAFVIQRLFQAVIVVVAVGLIAFTLSHYVGDPINNMVGQDATIEDRAALREELGLNDPVPIQFGRYILNVFEGQLGISYRLGRPVSELFAERLPATLELSLLSAILALGVGIPMGVIAAVYPRLATSRIFMTVSLFGISLPPFFVGILLIVVFSVSLQWLPSYGRGTVVDLGGGWTTGLLTISGLKALILPSITLALFQMTLIMRLVRSQMAQVLRTDYIKFAHARGLKPRIVNFRHALKNTLVPIITVTALQLGSIIAFAIITETVFQWPGMGLLFIQAVQFADVPVMAAYLMLVSVFFVLINLISDLLYFAVDPRLRSEFERRRSA
ncbi:MAG: ABC transporter permease [Alphaproteobacteria bacterium]|nr:MAG: ABC transporter permease [Alphaproteobacteria bacterium]